VRLAANQAHAIRPQRGRVIQRNVVAQPVAHCDIADLEAQLFGQFAGQRVALGFIRGDLAAGEFPAAGQFRRTHSLRDQESGGRDHRRGNDDLGRHGQ
jgi:hypothetical protein